MGIREPEIYGDENYEALKRYVVERGQELGVKVECFQTNYEGALLDTLQEAHRKGISGIVLNPGAFTHYSYALRDAIASIAVPVVEVHMSNIHKREEFRHRSVTALSALVRFVDLGSGPMSWACKLYAIICKKWLKKCHQSVTLVRRKI